MSKPTDMTWTACEQLIARICSLLLVLLCLPRPREGTSSLIEVPAHATFGHIKHKYIQPIEDIPAIQMRLIYMGQVCTACRRDPRCDCSLLRLQPVTCDAAYILLSRPQLTDDSKTPFDYNVCNESFIHLVRRPNESIKNEVITKLKLMANCRWCNKVRWMATFFYCWLWLDMNLSQIVPIVHVLLLTSHCGYVVTGWCATGASPAVPRMWQRGSHVQRPGD